MGVGVGMEVAGYRLVETIGEGGMAVVYLAQRVEDGGQVVLKVLREELSHNDEFRRRFLRESRYAADLRHPHVVPVYEAGEADGTLYIAMQYVEGRDLYDLLHEGPLEPEVAIAMLSQVAAALDAAHAIGLLHRDVKPGNVLVSTGQAGDFAHCYLTDFGLGKQSGKDSAVLTAPGRFVGTIYYTAPEQVLGREMDARVDVYSLGCLLFECLCGEPPFPGPTEVDVMQAHIQEAPPKASKRRSGLPKEIDAVIAKAMAKEAGDRYASCGELMEAARAAFGIAGVPVVAAAPPAGAPAPSGALRLRVTAGNAAGTEIQVDDELVIGRQAEGDGRLADDIEISRRHARIARTPAGEFAIEDLGSTNGTLVNGNLIQTLQPLRPGDVIELGGTRLVVEAGPAEAEAAAPEADVALPQTAAQPEAAQPPLPPPLRLEVDIAAGEVRLELGEGSEPLRLVHEGGRWRLRD